MPGYEVSRYRNSQLDRRMAQDAAQVERTVALAAWKMRGLGYAGGTALDPEVVQQLLSRATRRDPLDRLTPREAEVLRLMAEGRSNIAIAATLVVGEGAVEKHVSSIFSKLDLPPAAEDHRRVRAVLRWLEA